MHVSLTFLADFTVAVGAASVLGGIAARLRLSPILGYLIAGVAIGRFTPGYVANIDTVEVLAQLGLIFLLFSLGLGFSLGELRELGFKAMAGNVVVMAFAASAAGALAALFGYAHPFTLALTTAVSSTAVGVALLRTWNVELKLPGRFTISQQIVQDLVAVTLLVVATTPPNSLSLAGVAIPVLKAVGFVAVALVAGATFLQKLVRSVLSNSDADSLFGLFAALALVSGWLGYIAGLSFEFGAFVAGAVISEAAGSEMVASVIAPFRAVFVMLFFVFVGMLLDLNYFGTHALIIVAFTVVLVAFRFGSWFTLARIMGITASGAVLVGAAMTALGEFNVVLVDEAQLAKRLAADESQLMLGVTFLTIALSALIGPLLKRLTNPEAPNGAAKVP